MGRTRSYRIRVRKRKIKKRQKFIKNVCHFDDIDVQDGHLAKKNLWAVGGARKTKTKNARVARHVKGDYGKAILYSRHDKVQIVYMNQQLEEYYNSIEENDNYENKYI